jgi:hypothetical protein
MAKVSRPGYPMETRATVLDPLRWIVKFKPLLKTSAPNGKVAPKEARSSSQEVQRGNRYLSHSLAIEVAVARVPPRSQSLADLSSRELDALALLAKGQELQSNRSRARGQLQDGCARNSRKSWTPIICPHWSKRRCSCCRPPMFWNVGRNRSICQNVPGLFAKRSRIICQRSRDIPGTISTFARAKVVQQVIWGCRLDGVTASGLLGLVSKVV